MTDPMVSADVFLADDNTASDVPIWLVKRGEALTDFPLEPAQQAWLDAMGFEGKAKQQTVLPGADGRIAGVMFGLGNGAAGVPCGPSELLLGHLAQTLPPGAYRLAKPPEDAELAALAWGLGSYRYRRYKGADDEAPPKLRLPAGANGAAIHNSIDAV